MYKIKPMDWESATSVSKWCYPKPYHVYNMDSGGSGAQLMNGQFFSVHRDQKLMGFFCLFRAARVPWGEDNGYYPPGFIDIGLALHPDLTSQNMGLGFLETGLDFVRKAYPGQPIRLTVACFNQRAQKVYSRAGFQQVDYFSVPNGQDFFIMVLGD